MNKKGKLKIAIAAILPVLVIAVVVLCARQAERIQNENNIIGTWMQDNSEEVFTFQDNGSLIVNQDMPEAGISRGSASYEFVSINTIRVTQGEDSAEFTIKVSKDRLTIFFIQQEYFILQKQ